MNWAKFYPASVFKGETQREVVELVEYAYSEGYKAGIRLLETEKENYTQGGGEHDLLNKLIVQLKL